MSLDTYAEGGIKSWTSLPTKGSQYSKKKIKKSIKKAIDDGGIDSIRSDKYGTQTTITTKKGNKETIKDLIKVSGRKYLR